MPKKTYGRISGVAKECKKLYINIDGVARKVKKGFVNIDGKARQFYSAAEKITTIPSQSGALTYNGSVKNPTWSGYDSTKMDVSGAVSGTNAGTYTAVFTPKDGYVWPDESAAGKNITWSIDKAAGSMSINATSAKFTTASGSQQITVTRSGDGAVTASSSNTSVATCSVSGNVVTIRSGSTNGSCTITIGVAEGTNHTAPGTKSVPVTRDVFTVSTTLGASVSWAGYDWTVVHVTTTQVVLALSSLFGTSKFSDDSNNTTYVGSILAKTAKDFENMLPAEDLANAVSTTVNGVTSKIFVASKEQMDGGFSWFNSDARRICGSDNYWTSTVNFAGAAFRVNMLNGGLSSDNMMRAQGFRPFVTLKRT